MSIKHIVSYSGGVGSWAAARRVAENFGTEDLILLFADTYIEDDDLYRFIFESVCNIYGLIKVSNIKFNIPPLNEMDARKFWIDDFFVDLNILCPNFTRIKDGRDVWELMNDKNFISNSRVDNCSHFLKRHILWKWTKANYKPDECVTYLGIDWSEIHRIEKVQELRKPYHVVAPMCFKPYLSKKDMLAALELEGIETPNLYKLGFPHNNCGGFCVKAGQAQFKKLLENFPERYKYHEEKEQELIAKIEARSGKSVSILRRQRNNKKELLPMKLLREEIEANQAIDEHDWGGCGCAID